MAQRSSIWLSLTLSGAGTRVEQLCRALKSAVERGHLVSGERLPSTRQLANDLGCSRVTVEAAYQHLTAQGYITRQPGRGSFITHHSLATTPPASKGLPPALSQRGQRRATQVQCRDPQHLQAFNTGVPDVHAFPLKQWTDVTQQVMKALPAEQLLYGDPQGLTACRKAISHYLTLSRQVNCSPAQVLVMTSSQQALQLLAHVLIDEGDTVATEALCYPGAVNAFRQAGAQLLAQPLDGDGASPPTLAAKVAYLTPGHQYPLGMTMGQARRQQWLDWAQRHQSWIIEDDYDGEFHYEDAMPPSLQRVDRTQRVIYIGTFSKTLFPGIRLAYLVAPPSLMPSLVNARQSMDGHTSPLIQAVTAKFINEGYFANHLRLMKILYAARRRLLIDLLDHSPPDTLRLFPSQGGLQLAVEYLRGDTTAITRAAARQGLLLTELAPLCLTSPPLQGWILGFAALTPQAMRHAVTLLNQILQNAASQR